MKLKFLKEDALLHLKSNIEQNAAKYCLPTNEWIFEQFGEEQPFSEFKYEVPEFKMFTDSDRPETTDVQNAKIIYSALKDAISTSQATEERFWSGLEHGQFWDYMRYRWRLSEKEITPESIKSNYFFKQNPKRSLISNAMSRLWWVGRLAYDENNTIDSFYSLKYFETDFGTKIYTLFSSNYTNNPTITQAFLKAIIELEEGGEKISRDRYEAIIRFVNAIGGIYILDYLSENEIKEKILKYYEDTYKSSQLSLAGI